MDNQKDTIESMQEELEFLRQKNSKLRTINEVLIERVETGFGNHNEAYQSFENAVLLTKKIKERTQRLQSALAENAKINRQLTQENLQRKKVEQELLQAKMEAEGADESKTKFLAAISHDLLQPMNAAKLFVSALKENSNFPEKSIELIKSLAFSLEDMDSLLNSLVDISKLDAGQVTAMPGVFRISDLLDNLAKECIPRAEKAGITFRYKQSSAAVYSDSPLLARVIRNFLNNAFQYTEQGQMLLGCRRRADGLEIQVIDSGMGVPEEKLEEIFEEFKRGNLQRRKHDRGLGLGLAIVSRIAKVLEHEIKISSKVEKGSVFSIVVPYGQLSIKQQQSYSNSAELLKTEFFGHTVLVVDNEKSICEGMRALLETWSCQVNTATSLEEVKKKKLLKECPDMLIVDYHLDDNHTGTEVIEYVKKRCTHDVPVLIITANYSAELRQAAKKEGYYLMNKPVKPLKLRSVMRYLLLEI